MIVKQLKSNFVFEDMNIEYEINSMTESTYGCNCINYPREIKEPSGMRIFINYNYSKEGKFYNERILLDQSIINTQCPDIRTHEYRQSIADGIFIQYYNNLSDKEIKNISEYKMKLKILEANFKGCDLNGNKYDVL